MQMYKTGKTAAAFVLAIIFAVTAFTGCTTDIDEWVPAGMKEISKDIVDYNLFVPTEWTEDQSSGIVTAYVSATDRSSISMISFDLSERNQTLEEFWETNAAGFESFFTEMEYVTEGEAMLLGGIAANKYVYTATASEIPYKFMQIICINVGVVYIFTYTARTDTYDTHIENVEKILEYFSFK